MELLNTILHKKTTNTVTQDCTHCLSDEGPRGPIFGGLKAEYVSKVQLVSFQRSERESIDDTHHYDVPDGGG